MRPGLIKYVPLCPFCATPVYLPYCTFRRSFKENSPLSGAKTQVKYVNPGMFLLRRYRYILLLFITLLQVCIAAVQNSNIWGLSLKVNALSCWKYALHQTKPNSVNKCKTDIKTYLMMQLCHFNFLIVRFELLYQTVITQDSNRRSSPHKYFSVLHELSNKPIDTRLDICDANSISFQISKLFNIVLKS